MNNKTWDSTVGDGGEYIETPEKMNDLLINKNPCDNCTLHSPCTGSCSKWNVWYRDVLEKLWQYEIAEQEGKLMILPCKIGSTVYIIKDNCDYPDDCYQSKLCDKCKYRNIYIEEDTFLLKDIIDNLDDFGKTIFLKKEEAERILMEGSL